MCVSVCLSVCLPGYLWKHITCAIFTNFSFHVAYGRGSVLLWQGDKIPREWAVLEVFFPIDNELYSIAFGTHTKTAQPIEMSFEWMTRVGRRYHVLDGKGQFLGGIAAHRKVIGHSAVSCAKTAEPIDMPFWMKIRVGPRNHVLDVVQIPNGKAQFSGVFLTIQIWHSHCSAATTTFAAKGIIQCAIQAQIRIRKIQSASDAAYRLVTCCCLSHILCYGIPCRYGRAEGFRTKVRSCRWNCCKLVSTYSSYDDLYNHNVLIPFFVKHI